MFTNKKILFVAAHPDDELLGCGGTINRLVTEFKAEVGVVILGEGLTARDEKRDANARTQELSTHRDCILKAQKKLGYQHLSIHQLPDNRFDSVDRLDVIKVVESEITKFKPDYIFTHHGGDLNIDHRITFEAVMTAARPIPGERVKGIFCFETPSSTEWSFAFDGPGFKPNFFMDLKSNHLKAKIDAMAEYKFELRDYPHPRSLVALEQLAKVHGSRIGHEYAEAFSTVRFTL